MGTKCAIIMDDLPMMRPTKFRFIWPSGFRGDDFLEINQSETRIAFCPDPLTNMAATGNSCF
jgi:hypothetical protein